MTPEDIRVLRERERRFLAPGAAGHDHLIWQSAKGATVTAVDGRTLIDFTSGVLVANIGHAHPLVSDAIARQAGLLLNAYDAPHPLRGKVAERLVAVAKHPFSAAALLTTGAEAVDACLRIARAVTGRFSVLAFGDGFHGKSLSTTSIAGLPGNRSGVGPVMPGVMVAPYPNQYRPALSVPIDELAAACVDLAEELLATNATEPPAAIVVEPYLGAGGAVVPPSDFLPRLRSLADRLGALLVLDEVQSGFGRTGRMFAFQHMDVLPDLVAVAKGIASGVPMSAVLGRREHLAALSPGTLWSTYGGNPLACAAALATMDVLETPGLIERVETLGQHIAGTIRGWNDPGAADVRHLGMSFGIELVSDGTTKKPDAERALAVVHSADRHGLVVLPPAGRFSNVLRLAPPLTITDLELDEGLRALRAALEETATR